MKKEPSERNVKECPQISEEHYKIIEKKDYVFKPKERLKSIMLVENKKDKNRFIRFIDKWVKYRFTGRGKGEYIWDGGKSFNIYQEDDLTMITRILRFFGKALGIKMDEPLQDVVKRHEENIKDLNRQLAEKTLKLNEYKTALANKEKELELAKQIIGDINAFSEALQELKREIIDSKEKNLRKEKEIKDKIRVSKWVLGLDCQVKAKEKRIDVQAALDLHIKTDLNEDRVFEFKSPNLAPFTKNREDGRLYINSELAEGINQLIEYMKKADIYSNIDEGGTYKIIKPSGVIVIGYDVGSDQEKLLKNWNFHLKPHIRIITYNDLLESATQNLEHIRCARAEKDETKEGS